MELFHLQIVYHTFRLSTDVEQDDGLFSLKSIIIVSFRKCYIALILRIFQSDIIAIPTYFTRWLICMTSLSYNLWKIVYNLLGGNSLTLPLTEL